ncbi:hypothetical protein D3C85_1711280 [compost metagenome]
MLLHQFLTLRWIGGFLDLVHLLQHVFQVFLRFRHLLIKLLNAHRFLLSRVGGLGVLLGKSQSGEKRSRQHERGEFGCFHDS